MPTYKGRDICDWGSDIAALKRSGDLSSALVIARGCMDAMITAARLNPVNVAEYLEHQVPDDKRNNPSRIMRISHAPSSRRSQARETAPASLISTRPGPGYVRCLPAGERKLRGKIRTPRGPSRARANVSPYRRAPPRPCDSRTTPRTGAGFPQTPCPSARTSPSRASASH